MNPFRRSIDLYYCWIVIVNNLEAIADAIEKLIAPTADVIWKVGSAALVLMHRTGTAIRFSTATSLLFNIVIILGLIVGHIVAANLVAQSSWAIVRFTAMSGTRTSFLWHLSLGVLSLFQVKILQAIMYIGLALKDLRPFVTDARWIARSGAISWKARCSCKRVGVIAVRILRWAEGLLFGNRKPPPRTPPPPTWTPTQKP